MTGQSLIEKIEAHINAFVIPTLKLKFGLPRNYDSASSNSGVDAGGNSGSGAPSTSESGAPTAAGATSTATSTADSTASEGKQVKLAALWDALRERESWGANLKVILGEE